MKRTVRVIANPHLDKTLIEKGIGLPLQSERPEDMVQEYFVRYLRAMHPGILFNANYLSGVHLPISVAKRGKLLGSPRAQPDVELFEPRGGYYGAFIELKADGERLTKRNGDWVSPHVAEQAARLEELRSRGYWAEFAVGREEAIRKLEEYLSL